MTKRKLEDKTLYVVYGIRCLENGRLYVGATTDLERRLTGHVPRLRAGWHENPNLKADWLRYGEAAFEFIHFGWAPSRRKAELLEVALVNHFEALDAEGSYNIRKSRDLLNTKRPSASGTGS